MRAQKKPAQKTKRSVSFTKNCSALGGCAKMLYKDAKQKGKSPISIHCTVKKSKPLAALPGQCLPPAPRSACPAPSASRSGPATGPLAVSPRLIVFLIPYFVGGGKHDATLYRFSHRLYTEVPRSTVYITHQDAKREGYYTVSPTKNCHKNI